MFLYSLLDQPTMLRVKQPATPVVYLRKLRDWKRSYIVLDGFRINAIAAPTWMTRSATTDGNMFFLLISSPEAFSVFFFSFLHSLIFFTVNVFRVKEQRPRQWEPRRLPLYQHQYHYERPLRHRGEQPSPEESSLLNSILLIIPVSFFSYYYEVARIFSSSSFATVKSLSSSMHLYSWLC